MRRFVLILFGAIIILPFTAWAVWQVANPVRSDSSSNSIVNPALGKSDYPSNYTMRPAFNVHLSNASLQINIEKFAAAHQWNVIWRTTQQFPVLNRSPISGSTFGGDGRYSGPLCPQPTKESDKNKIIKRIKIPTIMIAINFLNVHYNPL